MTLTSGHRLRLKLRCRISVLDLPAQGLRYFTGSALPQKCWVLWLLLTSRCLNASFFFSEPRVQKERHLRSPRVRHDTFTLMPAAFTPARSRQVLGFGMSSYLTPCNRLICDFCSSGQRFAAGFLQIPPHDGHPCLWLTLPPDGRVRDLHPRVSRHAGRTRKIKRK